MVGRDADVRGAAAVDHPEDRGDDAADGADFAALGVARRGNREEVAEEFVGAVDEMDVQDG